MSIAPSSCRRPGRATTTTTRWRRSSAIPIASPSWAASRSSAPSMARLLPGWKSQKGMLGIRVAFNHEKAPWIVDGTADWFWSAAQEHDIPLMIFAPDSPEAIGQIAQRHPKLRLIIDHMGLATRGPEAQAHPRADRADRALCEISERRGQAVRDTGIFGRALSVSRHDRASADAGRGLRPAPLFLGHRPHASARQGALSPVRDALHRGARFPLGRRPRWVMGDALLDFLGWK